MSILQIGRIAEGCDTQVAHAMLHAVAVAALYGSRFGFPLSDGD